ncbi:hypothetical protein ACSNOK_30105 [Streptomyces sp. URMC 126]|uniref:hypothetical protein n=1 Tax=Streptomyces sp. URMC 126 TaxID=3423401 RepID=UPI003F1C4BFF
MASIGAATGSSANPLADVLCPDLAAPPGYPTRRLTLDAIAGLAPRGSGEGSRTRNGGGRLPP